MLFNSYVFIFAFLPITILGFGLLGKLGTRRAGIVWLIACSSFYYAYWNPKYLLLLFCSMAINYAIGALWLAEPAARWRKLGLILGLVFNLSVLGYFKYAKLLVVTWDGIAHAGYPIPNIILPLGISFFTFQKIAYLVDVYHGRGYSRNFLDYCLFVLFFPQLIAGPIVHPREILPQFSRRSQFGLSTKNLGVGLTLFTFGLAKKVLIADGIAPTAALAFNDAAIGKHVGFTDAWLGAITYAMRIYFDFSGYTDMAIGLGRMFGVRLPVNFNSPYKAETISDFWRRWHMTLSRFLLEYLYIPLGGNRKGEARRYLNLMITMLLGGLWHGANWTFMAWGGLHGLYLIVDHAVHGHGRSPARGKAPVWRRFGGRMITFIAVVVAWVFFRADDFTTAGRMLRSMSGIDGFHLEEIRDSHARWPMAILLVVFVMIAPNSQQVMRMARPALGVLPLTPREQKGKFLWWPDLPWAAITAALAVASIYSLSRASEFIYYQF
jgi:alginate O-acetyltransferase complex protein AlgI